MNESSANPQPWQPIEELLAWHSRQYPRKPAIVDVNRNVAICFKDLDAVVDGLAKQLHARGITRGQHVVLLVGDGIETLCVWLALWRLAAVVCPFDRSQLDAVITREAIAILKPALVLHGPRWCRRDLPAELGPMISFGHWPTQVTEQSDLRLEPVQSAAPLRVAGARQDDVAAACATSGTSGHLKIILHDHRSFAANGIDIARLLRLDPSDRLLEYRSFSWFSPQILSLMPLLQLGLTLYVAREFSSSRFPQWLSDHRITVAVGVPTVLNILLRQPSASLRAQAAGLRLMTSSSAPLPSATWSRFEREVGVPIVNLYGSSEAGWISGNQPDYRTVGSVGRPVEDLVLRVVDGHGQPCGIGKSGEIVIEGSKLALGYLRGEGELKPIRGRPFHTHDVGYLDEQGVLRILGRRDQLIIRGGVKISPAEVEDALLSHPDVAEAVAVGVPDEIFGQEVVGFVVPKLGQPPLMRDLMAHAHQMLPEDRRPKFLFELDSLPRNARGKLLRHVLRDRGANLVADLQEVNSPHGHMSNGNLPYPYM